MNYSNIQNLHTIINIDPLIETNAIHSQIELKVNSKYFDTLLINRQNTNFHHSRELIQAIYNAIKNGDLDKLSIYASAPSNGETGILSNGDILRHVKNFLICTVTLYCNAAIEGGLPHEEAYTLSDAFIQTIEEINSIPLLDELWYKIVFTYAIKVKSILEIKYSKPVFNCIYLIIKHLYNDISLSKLSTWLNLSPQYLSTLFKKETGISISEYIFIKKIEEAKYLLTYTDKSILEISTLLCFHDQSYFTKIFKRYAEITPKKFKAINHSNI